MWQFSRFLLAAFLIIAGPANAQTSDEFAGKSDADLRLIGERIYREGVLPSGKPLQGLAQAGVQRVGKDAACVACHRRSGFGTSEGSFAIRSITGTALYGWQTLARPVIASPPSGLTPANPGDIGRIDRLAVRKSRIAALSGSRQRPPFDDTTLARAIREGVDVQGGKLNAGMPRYELNDVEIKPLLAYLKTLSVQPSPGVSDNEIHFATVIQPGVDAAKRRAMLDVLHGFIQDKNAGTRSEVLRKQAGTERMYRAYRKWVLHVWDLSGPSDTWGRQLDAYYAAQPVFSMIGGLGEKSWQPVHDFSERNSVPCIFPEIDLPVTAAGGFYTVYFSKGITLEAEALAKFLLDQEERAPITQVFSQDEVNTAAALAFRKAFQAKAGIALDERVLDTRPDKEYWQKLSREKTSTTLVLWLSAQDLAEAEALFGAESQVKTIYLSSTLFNTKRRGVAPRGGVRVRLVLSQDLPLNRDARLLRIKSWLHNKGIPLNEEKVLMNTYFAVSLTADVAGHLADTFSRDYFLERIEHMTGNTVTPSLYPHMSLGPDQRFASKGSYIVQVEGEDGKQLRPISGWIVPDLHGVTP